MHKSRLRWLLQVLLGLVVALGACRYEPINHVEITKMMQFASLRVTPGQEHYEVGEPAWVSLELHNESLKLLEFGVSAPSQDFQFELFFNRRPVTRTDYGARVVEEQGKLTIKTINKNESYRSSLDLSELFEIYAVGTYVLFAHRELLDPVTNQWTKISSAPFSFEVHAKGGFGELPSARK